MIIKFLIINNKLTNNKLNIVLFKKHVKLYKKFLME